MNPPNLSLGVPLNLDFAGYPVFFLKHEGSYYVECKKVLLAYDDYLLYLKDPSKDVLGYNIEGKPCKVKHYNGTTTIGCLKDTTEKFNLIIKSVKILIKNDNKKQKLESGKSK